MVKNYVEMADCLSDIEESLDKAKYTVNEVCNDMVDIEKIIRESTNGYKQDCLTGVDIVFDYILLARKDAEKLRKLLLENKQEQA